MGTPVLMATRTWVTEQLNQAVASATTSIFQWKGHVSSFSNLPAIPNDIKEGATGATGQDNENSFTVGEGNNAITYKVGYVYNALDTGANYVLTSREVPESNPKKYVFAWDKFSEDDYAAVKSAVEALQTSLGADDTSGQRKRIKDLEDSVSTIETTIGSGSLSTTATNLIAAINEVKTTADAAIPATDIVAYADAAAGKVIDAASLKTFADAVKTTADAALPAADVLGFSSVATATDIEEAGSGTATTSGKAADAVSFKQAIQDANSNAEGRVSKNDIATSIRAVSSAEDTKVASEKVIATEKANLLSGTTQFTRMYVAKTGDVVFETANKLWKLVVDESTGTLALEDITPSGS